MSAARKHARANCWTPRSTLCGKRLAATRAEEVAARAGVSKGTLFLYFQSKEELFKAVVRENISGRFTEWRAELDVFEGTSPELLAYCMNSWWERQA